MDSIVWICEGVSWRGFMCNFLFQNIGNIFNAPKDVIEARQKETNDKLDALSGKLSELTMENTVKQHHPQPPRH